MDMVWFGLAFCGIAGIFLLIGFILARKQGRLLSTYREVPAVVLSSEVVASGGEGDTFSPAIRFSYLVAGKTLEAATPLPIGGMSASGRWAHRIVERFPVGMKTSAYVDPTDSGKAFLLREASFFPYLLILFPMIHVAVGLGCMLGGGDPPWFGPARATLITALVWNAVGVWCLMHFRGNGGQMRRGTKIMFGAYALVGLIGMGVAATLSNDIPPLPARRPADVEPLEKG